MHANIPEEGRGYQWNSFILKLISIFPSHSDFDLDQQIASIQTSFESSGKDREERSAQLPCRCHKMTEEVRLHFFDGISVFLWKIEQEQMVATSVYTFLLIVESRTLPPLPPSPPPPPHTHTHYPHTPCCVIAMIFKLIRVHYGCFFHPTDRKNMKYKQKFSMVDDFISHIYKGLH